MDLDNRKVCTHKKERNSIFEGRGCGCLTLPIKLSRAQGIAGIVPGGALPYGPIWGRAAGQGMVFGLLCPEQGILFYANLS